MLSWKRYVVCMDHGLITIQIEHEMSSFQGLGFYVYKNPEAVAQRSYTHAALNYITEKDPVSWIAPPPTLTQIRKKTAQPGSPGKVKHSILILITIQIEH